MGRGEVSEIIFSSGGEIKEGRVVLENRHVGGGRTFFRGTRIIKGKGPRRAAGLKEGERKRNHKLSVVKGR